MKTKTATKPLKCACCKGVIVPGTPIVMISDQPVHAAIIECDLNLKPE